MRRPIGRPLVAGLLAVVAASCASAAAAPPATAARPAAPAPSAGTRDWTDADVRFVQGMIAHHAQALAMTALLPDRTRRDDMRLLAERITVSQQDEIALMRRWLERRGQPAPPAGAHAAHHAGADAAPAMPGMPGMLTPEELDRLAAATGADFDRLFLEDMIRHHEGALTMVAGLLATPGAAQGAELFSLASDIDADQRAEIRRMRALLERSVPGGAPRR